MTLHRFRVFTLEEANRLLPTVARLTERTQERLKALEPSDAARASAGPSNGDEARRLVEEWARSVLALGAQPKGVFTVDFRAPDPNLLWCWAPGESEITHRHFTWESFKDRIAVGPATDIWPGRN